MILDRTRNAAAYYKWLHRKLGQNEETNQKLAALAESIHKEHPDMGYRRIRDKIEHDHGLHANDKRILRICRKKRLRSVIKGRHNCCTRPAVDPYYTAENVLNRDFHADKYNQKWVNIRYYTYDRPQRHLGIRTPSEYHEKLVGAV